MAEPSTHDAPPAPPHAIRKRELSMELEAVFPLSHRVPSRHRHERPTRARKVRLVLVVAFWLVAGVASARYLAHRGSDAPRVASESVPTWISQ